MAFFIYLSFPLQYGIVIDSGSSRSNVYVYEWPGEKENETGVVTETLNCRVAGESLPKFWMRPKSAAGEARTLEHFTILSTGDGISEMKVDPEKDKKSWEAFQVCMDKAMKAIPAEKHKSTPLFLGATAGMRLLQ